MRTVTERTKSSTTALAILSFAAWTACFTSHHAKAAPGTFSINSPGDTTSPGPLLSSNILTLVWNSSANAASYLVNVRDVTLSPTGPLYNYPANGTSMVLTLYPNSKYKWNVTAYSGPNQTGTSTQSSNSRWFQIGVCNLAVPADISLGKNPIAPGTRLTLTYSVANSGNCNSSACHNRIQLKKGSSSTTTVEDYFSIPLLTPGQTQTFSAQLDVPSNCTTGLYSLHIIVDVYNETIQSTTADDVHSEYNILTILNPPVAPNDLVAFGNDSVISLAWTDVSFESGYILERKAAGTGTWATYANLAHGSGAYLDYNATPGVLYFYRLSATNGVGSSPASSEVSATRTFAPVHLEIGGSLDDVQVFLDGNQVNTAPSYQVAHGAQVTVRKNLLDPFQFVDHWSLVDNSGTHLFSGMAISTPMLSDSVLQAIISTRNSTPHTGGTISGSGVPIITVPPSGTSSPEVVRHVQRSHDLVCWHDYDIDPTTTQISDSVGPCSFGQLSPTVFFRTAFDVRVHAEPVLLFPIAGSSATTARVTSLLDHCNNDSLKSFPSSSSPNSTWYLNGVIGAYDKDMMFMTYKGEILCPGNSTVQLIEGLPHFTKFTPLDRPLDFNWDWNSATPGQIGYSGHPGYDFGVTEFGANAVIVACEKGVIVPQLSGSYENRIFIEHEALGLATAYLHMKKWSTMIFDHNDTAPGSKRFYYPKAVTVEKGDVLGLAGGAGKCPNEDAMCLDRFPVHLHVELYRVVYKDGQKYYLLMDPYGAYSATGKQAYGTSWLSSQTPTHTYNPIDYAP